MRCPISVVFLLLQILVVMDGTDKFCYRLKLPTNAVPLPISSHTHHQYLFAGGAVSPHTSEKHITLVRAENAKISWKLGSLSLLNGECTLVGVARTVGGCGLGLHS